MKLPKIPFYKKKIDDKKRADFAKKAEAFIDEYRLLILKHSCDFQPYLKIGENGTTPEIRIINVTQEIARVNNLKKEKNDKG